MTRTPLTFLCSHCGETFANRWRLRAHLLEHGIVVPAEWQPSADAKPRVAAIPSELSGQRRAGLAQTATPPPPSRLAGHRRHRRLLVKRFAMVTAALLVVVFAASSAWALFSSTASSSAKVTTGTWGNWLAFTPGSSQATHYSASGCPQSVTIASLDKRGKLSCDFGDALPSTTTSWSDVFRATSTAPASLKVSFVTSGAIAPFIASVGFASDTTGGALSPKQRRSVAVRLTVPKTAAPGTYSGTLTVAVVGSSESHAIPLTVTVLAKKPKEARLFTLCPGRSKVLPSGSATPPTTPPSVACSRPDGTIALGFGQVPLAQTARFPDCLRLASVAGKTASVTLALSGPVAQVVQRVGFWGGSKLGIEYKDLTLRAKQTIQVAIQIDPAANATLGSQSGTLTVTAKLPDGSLQQSELPVTLDVVDPGADPSPSPSSSPSATPQVTASPSVTPSASVSSSASSTPSTSSSPSVSPQPSTGPSVTAPSASPPATLVVFLVPVSLVTVGLTALRRRRRSP